MTHPDFPNISPVTAVLRASPALPVPLLTVLANLRRASDDIGTFRVYLGHADFSRAPISRDIEMIEGLRHSLMIDYAEERLTHGRDVQPLVIAGLLDAVRSTHFIADPSLLFLGALRCLLLDVAKLLGKSTLTAHLVPAFWALYLESKKRSGNFASASHRDTSVNEAEEIERIAQFSGVSKITVQQAIAVKVDEAVIAGGVQRYKALVAEQHASSDDDGTVSADEAAALARVSKMTITRWAETDANLGQKVGGRWRINRAALLAKI